MMGAKNVKAEKPIRLGEESIRTGEVVKNKAGVDRLQSKLPGTHAPLPSLLFDC
jgi:hypothetical protein